MLDGVTFARPIGRALIEAFIRRRSLPPPAMFARPIGRALIEAGPHGHRKSKRFGLHGQLAVPSLKPPCPRYAGGGGGGGGGDEIGLRLDETMPVGTNDLDPSLDPPPQ